MPEDLKGNLEMVKEEWSYIYDHYLELHSMDIARAIEHGLHALMVTMEKVIELEEKLK